MSYLRAATVSVSVGNNFFNQKDITVNVGDTVTWVFIASGHDTVANDGTWSSGIRGAGSSFSFNFTAAHAGRRFDYFCTPHRQLGMVGSVTVRAAVNQPPTVSLTAPAAGATFSTTDTITFSATATDDAGVNRVEFYSDGTQIGSADTAAPYSVTASLPAGQHTITAKAFDGAGLSATSTGRTITVNAPNQPPTVTLTGPANGATFLTSDTITFSADANDDAGVNRVEFYSDGNLISTADTSAPYSVAASLSAGQHTITAKAFDGPGLSTTSGSVTITVNAPNQPPTVTLTAPANGATFSTTDTITFSANASDDAGVNRVEFYSDGNLIGTDTSAPYSVTATLAAGNHTITAKAFDGSDVSTTSAAVQIQVTATSTAPQIGSITINGVVVTVTATATSGVTYELESTVDFGNWSVVNSAIAANGSVTLNDVVNTDYKFYRVVER